MSCCLTSSAVPNPPRVIPAEAGIQMGGAGLGTLPTGAGMESDPPHRHTGESRYPGAGKVYSKSTKLLFVVLKHAAVTVGTDLTKQERRRN